MAESNGSDKGFVVRVVASDPVLSRALTSRLQREIDIAVSTNGASQVGGGAIIVTTPLDCAPARCREMVDRGAVVLVLAALPRRNEEDAYRQSGASGYLPMMGDGSNLADAVRRIIEAGHGAPVETDEVRRPG
jgi:hypothetical protein